jgi:4-amino-4-deoxy-L-arabinose transferase-like glycosyltransferase
MGLWGYNGYAISEFPVLYWMTGKLYKVFGYHELIARLVTYSVFLIGLIFLFELCFKFFKNKWFALVPALIIYSSPIMVYYALNFLPNIPAFSLMLCSWFFFFKYLDSRKFNDFVLCSSFALLSSLLKPVEIFNYLIMFGLLCFEYLQWFGLSHFKYSKKEIRSIIIIFCGVIYGTFLWINYAKGYANSFGYHGNLLGILPIWEMTHSRVIETFQIIQEKWAYQLFWTPAYFLLLVLFFCVILFYKRINRYLFLAIMFTFLAQVVYIILFFDTFYHHDYYMINIYVVPILVLIGFIQVWESFKVPKFINISALIFLSAFLFITLKHSKHIIHNRYYGFLKEGINPHLQTITPYLRSIGINRDDIIISVPDNSPNMSLYLMNQKGWTNSFVRDSSNIPYFINQGAKYLIVNESIFVHSDWYEPYMKNLIAEYHGIKIYEIKK